MKNKTSRGVSVLKEYDNLIFYRLNCDCLNEDCDITFTLEYDKEFGSVELQFYTDLEWTSYWGNDNWFIRQWKKIKYSFRLLFKGHIKLENQLLIQDEQHLKDFLNALEEGCKKLREYKYKKMFDRIQNPYTYDGNEEETYTIFKHDEKLFDIDLNEDDVIELVKTLNDKE